MVSPADRTKERWRKLTLELDRLPRPVIVIGNWRTGPGTVLHINPAWIETSGLTAAETLGHPATDFFLTAAGEANGYRAVRQDAIDGRPHSGTLKRAQKGLEPASVRVRAWTVRLTRETQDYLIIAERPGGGRAGIRRSATAAAPSGKLLSFERPNGGNGRAEKLRLAEELVNAQQRFQHSLESCAFGVERMDVTGRISYANPIYHELLGYDDHELIGENVYQRLLDPVQARVRENYTRHIVAMEPPVTPIFATYRRKDGTPIRLRLDWDYDRSVSGVTIGLISIVTPVNGWSGRLEGDAETPRPDAGETEAAAAREDAASKPDDYTRGRLLLQTLHAARVWASILAHRHPEGDDAAIVAKVDNAIDDALQLLGRERRPPIAAARYYEESAPLKGLVVAVLEPADILRDSLIDLLRSWGCNPVGIDSPDAVIPALERTGRVPDMLIAGLDTAIGDGNESVVRALWRRYGPGIPCILVSNGIDPTLERFIESVGMKTLRQPVHPIELRSTMLALQRESPRNRRK